MQGRGVGYPWWVNHGNPVILLAKPGKHRQQQAEFSASGCFIDKFGDCTHRPATAWQRRIEAAMAGAVCVKHDALPAFHAIAVDENKWGRSKISFQVGSYNTHTQTFDDQFLAAQINLNGLKLRVLR